MTSVFIIFFIINMFCFFYIKVNNHTYYITDNTGNEVVDLIYLYVGIYILINIVYLISLKFNKAYLERYKFFFITFLILINFFLLSSISSFFFKIYYIESNYILNGQIIWFNTYDSTYYINKVFSSEEKLNFMNQYWSQLNIFYDCGHIIDNSNIQICLSKNNLFEIKIYLNDIHKYHLNNPKALEIYNPWKGLYDMWNKYFLCPFENTMLFILFITALKNDPELLTVLINDFNYLLFK